MMNDLIRRPGDQYSPKSSPRGSRSPVVPRQDSTGTLKTTISLGKTPAIVHSGPFYLLKPEAPSESDLTGATNLILHHNLEHSYNKFCSGRKLKDQLSSFLPNLPGNIDIPAGTNDMSSLKSLIERPPICGKELLPLTQSQLMGFRLHPGPIPEQLRPIGLSSVSSSTKKHKKHKKDRDKKEESTPSYEGSAGVLDGESGSLSGAGLAGAGPAHDKKHGKKRKHDDEREKERKKKKKEKKRKRAKHSPEPNAPSSDRRDNGLD